MAEVKKKTGFKVLHNTCIEYYNNMYYLYNITTNLHYKVSVFLFIFSPFRFENFDIFLRWSFIVFSEIIATL